MSMDAKSAARKRGRPVFSHDEPIDSFHSDGESSILCLRYHEGCHYMLHCSYEGDHVPFLTLPGLEPRPLSRPARSQSLYRLL
jgi:hypothetical protein